MLVVFIVVVGSRAKKRVDDEHSTRPGSPVSVHPGGLCAVVDREYHSHIAG